MREIIRETIADFLLEVEDGDTESFNFPLYIDTICKIPVRTSLEMVLEFQAEDEDGGVDALVHFTTELIISLRSELGDGIVLFHDIFEDQEDIVNEENIIRACREQVDLVIRALKDIEFDTFSGMFVKPDDVTKKFNQYINQQLIECSKIKFLGSQCCVCYEDTVTQTSCTHFLCIGCLSQLQDKKCPICRQAFEVKNHKLE